MKTTNRRGAANLRRGLAAFVVSSMLAGCGVFGPDRRVPAWEEPPPPPREAPIVLEGSLTQVTLDNGLELMLLEDHRLPVVSVGITFRRGAAIESIDEAGVAELTSELMNRGAGELDATALAARIDQLGASLAVEAGWDSMSVGLSGLARDTDALLEILDDVVRRPRFEEAEAEAARAEQIAGLKSKADDPQALITTQAKRVLYPEHRYGIDFDGTIESVSGLDAASARAFHVSVVQPNNGIFHVVGDFETDLLLERVRARLQGWKPGSVPAPVAAPPSITPTQRRIVVANKPELVQARIWMGHEGIARTDERRLAAALLNNVLGGSGFSSRMMKELRSEEGLTYGVGTGFSLRREPGPFNVSTFTRVPETRRAVDILLSQLESIRGDDPVSDSELANAKSYSMGQFALSLETPSAVLASLVNLNVYGLPDDSLDTYRGRLRAVDADQVHAVAEALVHPDRIAIVLLGPAETLVPLFSDLGEVEVVEP